jgi:hypothetical protein
MGLPIAPILIGAGVGALGGALTGNNPFKTALLGGALGTGAGALGLGGAGATAAGSTALPTAVSAADLLPTSLAVAPESAAAASPLFGYTASGLSPFATAAEASAIPTAAELGTGFGADTIANMAVNDPTLLEQIKPYMTANNVMGAANMALNYKPTQRSPAPQGHVSQGQMPQGGLGAGGVEGLLAEIAKQRKTQHQPISLLVG